MISQNLSRLKFLKQMEIILVMALKVVGGDIFLPVMISNNF
jgi:hypothetical protein